MKQIIENEEFIFDYPYQIAKKVYKGEMTMSDVRDIFYASAEGDKVSRNYKKVQMYLDKLKRVNQN